MRRSAIERPPRGREALVKVTGRCPLTRGGLQGKARSRELLKDLVFASLNVLFVGGGGVPSRRGVNQQKEALHPIGAGCLCPLGSAILGVKVDRWPRWEGVLVKNGSEFSGVVRLKE